MKEQSLEYKEASATMKVGVTGGAGYIGSLLVKKLIERGHSVVAIDNLINGDYKHLKDHRIDNEAELVEGDIRDLNLLKENLSSCEAVAHLAAIPGLVKCEENPKEATIINIYGTYNVLKAVEQLNIEKIVFCSSAAVYGIPEKIPVTEEHPLKPLNLYGITKLAGEKLVDAFHNNYGIKTITLRFGNVYGIGLYTNYDTVIPKFIRMALNGENLTVYGDGTSTRDYVHVEDIAQAVVKSLESECIGGEVFNVGSETVLLGELAKQVVRIIEKMTGKTVGVENLPPRPGETKELSYNLEKISKHLDYKPSWGITEGIEQILNYLIDIKE